ncbi:MAG: Two-component system sensor histidine kinase [uncultured Corynebacteriales bacterium]|uniref:histidine kinase n=1 Tax=uncultured Mycobacteriales bacterium TaxID=581187 RepID=A0A6J4I148_9ACTN|nr:MAG: Two-component system sensor histidine kinase [uncultured Corynebacteriales bacterium]
MTPAALARPRRPGGGALTLATLAAGQVAMAVVTLQAEYASFVRPPNLAVAVDVAAGILSLVLLPLVRRAPVRLALLQSLLVTVSAAATPAAGTAELWVAQRRRLPVAVAVGCAGVLGHVVRASWRPVPDRPLGLWVLVIVVSYAALVGWGAQTQARRALLSSLRDRARRAEQEQAHRIDEARRGERTRIAREMHDVLAHRLTLLAAYAGALEFRPDAPPEELARASGVVRAGAHEALEELREVIGLLRDDPGADGAERDRPQPTLADLPRLLDETRAAGTPVALRDRLGPAAAEVPDGAGRTVHRVVQEALTNARKHASGRPVTVLLAGRPGKRLLVVVTNPVSGAAAEPVPGSGTGLVGLRERVALAGGSLDTRTGGGDFRLWVVLPWPR